MPTPIKMIYEPDPKEPSLEVDVYHFHQLDDSLECYVTGWVCEKGYWITAPIHTMRPVSKPKKKQLNG